MTYFMLFNFNVMNLSQAAILISLRVVIVHTWSMPMQRELHPSPSKNAYISRQVIYSHTIDLYYENHTRTSTKWYQHNRILTLFWVLLCVSVATKIIWSMVVSDYWMNDNDIVQITLLIRRNYKAYDSSMYYNYLVTTWRLLLRE